jgi:TPR repeat protein
MTTKSKTNSASRTYSSLAAAPRQAAYITVIVASIFLLSGCALFGHSYKPDLQTTGWTHQNMSHSDYNLVRQRAQEGDANAQYNMGYRYYYGIGVKEDVHRAKGWFARSASKGNHLAKQALHDIGSWEGNYRDGDSPSVTHTPAPAYLPPPPSNRHNFKDELAEDH